MRSTTRIALTGFGAVHPDGMGPVSGALRSTARLGDAEEVVPGTWRRTVAQSTLDPWLPPAGRRRLDHLAQMAVAAVRAALADRGPILVSSPPGLFVNTLFGSATAVARLMASAGDPDGVVSPLLFPGVVANQAAGQAAAAEGLTGPSTVFGGHGAFEYACLQLMAGRISTAVVLGLDDISPLLARVLARSGMRLGAPAPAPQLLTEAAAALVLETEAHAQLCGAHARVWVAPEWQDAPSGAHLDSRAWDATWGFSAAAWLPLAVGTLAASGIKAPAALQAADPLRPGVTWVRVAPAGRSAARPSALGVAL